ncbi:hypothetical protein HNQ51_000267 [Inhella inkyongensis]|uniref:DUF2894 domain-containing protein n=1 Tax=Inhella inkyongensis TaxID=392593 RepID=A0A840S295_9BURK|nr:DUF2894 domain-containing protein [Inhella inkyongensis]MBB5202974.1 hypothetical protein [Inhella inkyongensis]
MDELLHVDPLAWLLNQPAAACGDPLRQQTLQGLARRAAALPEGPLRRRLCERLLERLQAPHSPPPAQAVATAPTEHPLRDWMAALQARAGGPGEDLRSLQQNRRSFGRLRLAQRLAQAPASPAAPTQSLGPLNTLALVPKALALLQQTSPDYLERLVGYLDALAVLAPESAAPLDSSKPGKSSKPTKRRSKP